MNTYNQAQNAYIQSYFHPDNFNSDNTKRKRDEYESYKFIEEEEQISSDSEEEQDEELLLMQGYQPDRKRTKSSTSTIPTNSHINLSHHQSQQDFLNNNIIHHNNESGSIVENNQDNDCMMMDDEESYSYQQQQEEPSLFVPPNLQNDPYSIQQFEYKRRQVYNHYRKEQERKMEQLELKQSMEQGETNFRLNPILRYLHNERKNRINSPFE